MGSTLAARSCINNRRNNNNMTKNISLTMDEDLLKFLDDLAASQHRSRSAMVSIILEYIKDHTNIQINED